MTLTPLGVPTVPSLNAGPTHDRAAEAPTDGPLLDTYGRAATDLRVSLTDRCNLRCSYCMPAEGLDWLPGEQLLRPDELARLLHIAVSRLGITSVRPRPEISLTTNGVGLARRAAALAEAGLDRVNISLDSVDRARFAAITRRDRLVDVLDGLAAA